MSQDKEFDDLYFKALERKRLFKEYMSRHQVMEKLNDAISTLYESGKLPDDPLEFIAEQICPKKPTKR